MSKSNGVVCLRQRQDHLRFLDAYYSKVHPIYDITRKYYLFGRDRLLAAIASLQPALVVEVGSGTGRNLAKLRERLPGARLGGVEPCAVMRRHSLAHHPWLTVSRDLAEDADLTALMGEKPDVVFFSYSLSMVQDPEQALANCFGALAPQGRTYVLDFGRLSGPRHFGSRVWSEWLHRFHVYPERLDYIFAQADERIDGPVNYWRRAMFCRPTAPQQAFNIRSRRLS